MVLYITLCTNLQYDSVLLSFIVYIELKKDSNGEVKLTRRNPGEMGARLDSRQS
jgi:hypothetical protein